MIRCAHTQICHVENSLEGPMDPRRDFLHYYRLVMGDENNLSYIVFNCAIPGFRCMISSLIALRYDSLRPSSFPLSSL